MTYLRESDDRVVLPLHTHLVPEESADFILRRLFAAGLALGSCVRLLDEKTGDRLGSVLSELDEIGREVRRSAVFRSRADAVPGAGAPWWRLVAELGESLGELAGCMDGLCRPDDGKHLSSLDLLEASQSLERALVVLRSNG